MIAKSAKTCGETEIGYETEDRHDVVMEYFRGFGYFFVPRSLIAVFISSVIAVGLD